MNWYLEVLRNNYANFTGRARRQEYWMYTLVNCIIAVVLYVLAIALRGNALGAIFMVAYALYALAVLIPGLAVAARRLHDTGRSGWWQLIALVPFVGGIILLVFLVLEGHQGSNEFGGDPKAVSV
ncbi:MAG TPA: DUF805 domain-containing protein [Oleiagrimonas sp.]|nr:DUF805 domain-containing protein [Oleiagrimonas sp.]